MKAPTTEIDCLSIYERMAASYFNDLRLLKAQRKILDNQIKEAENRLSQALAQGDLRLWQPRKQKHLPLRRELLRLLLRPCHLRLQPL